MAAVDNFSTNAAGLSSPCERLAAVTPHDTDELGYVTRALFVGGAGTVKVTTVKGDTVTLTGVAAGSILPIRAKLVFSTGTTATYITAMW